MSPFSRSLFAAAIAAAQPTPSPAAASRPEELIVLDRVVVSAGSGARTAFELAQGTSVLAGGELAQRLQSTMGETLASLPGVNATSNGPGASRPIIRGLGGDRIRILSGGIGALDASNVSPDHNTSIEPLFARSIEVLRGPSTLLYGSSALGGVVNVIDNAIPDEPAGAGVHGRIEARGFGAADERAGGASLAVAAGANAAVQLNGFRQALGGARIPGVARIDSAAPPDQPSGALPNSDVDSRSGSIGASWFAGGRRIGGAVGTYATTYGVPIDEPIRIRMRQKRLDLETGDAGGNLSWGGLDARLRVADYTHSEIVDGNVNTTFRNRAWEGRAELPYLRPGVSGRLGLQASRSDFSAVGEEVVTPPSVSTAQAVFGVGEWTFPGWTLETGARAERLAIGLGAVDPALPAVPGYAASSGLRRRDTALGGSVGVVVFPSPDWSIALSGAYTERLPTAQERFANGPHGGTGAYEVGTSALARERSLGTEAILRRRAGFVTGSLGVFVNRFQDYVYEQELPAGSIPAANNPEDLTPYQFVGRDAEFRGAEFEAMFHLHESARRRVHVRVTVDAVRAQQLTDNHPLPRIPPMRFGAVLHVDEAQWSFELEARHTASQDRVAPGESRSSGYTLLGASIARQFAAGPATIDAFLRGTNLGNREARPHTSFIKDFAPLPGLSLTLGIRASF